MNNSNLKLKISLLSCCFVGASMNAISGNIPEMANAFSHVPLYVVELISTIPSLFQMIAILISHSISKKIGYKNCALFGILLCGISGIAPIILNNIYLILISRAFFGFGTGLISSTLLTLIVYFFSGKTRSSMIGMQGSIGGLGSLVATFIAGRLLTYGWNISFYTYFIAFIILGIFAIFVPKVSKADLDQPNTGIVETNKRLDIKTLIKIIGYAFIMLISVSLATLYVIKCSTLATTQGFASVQDGSTIIMLISLGSLCSGALYGRIVSKIGKISLTVFYILMVLGYSIAGISSNLFVMLVSAFIIGFGYMAFVPYIQDTINKEFINHKETATSIILVSQSLGGFLAPYLGNMIGFISPNITNVFFIAATLYGILIFISISLAMKKQEIVTKEV